MGHPGQNNILRRLGFPADTGPFIKFFFLNWLPTLSKPYYLIIFVDTLLYYINVVATSTLVEP